MEFKIKHLADDISGLIKNFIKNEVSEYKENYDHMLNSPLFKSLRNEVNVLKEENIRLNEKITKNNIELVIRDESPDTEYEFDRKYKEVNDIVEEEEGEEEEGEEEEGEEEEEEEGEEFTEEEGEEEEFTEDDGGLGACPQEEEFTEEEGEGEEEEGEEFTEEEGEEEEFTEEEEEEDGGLGQAPEAQLSSEDASACPQEEEEEVIEFEYKGVQYFVTDEENGDIYANVDDDIGDLVGKIKNKNVILF